MFQYEMQKEGVRITGYRGSETHVSIPEVLEGQPVVGIGKKCFVGNKQIKEVIVPKHVTFMDDWAFANCNQLARVELPGRQMEFGKGVFQGCVSLGKIVAGTSECRTEEEQQRAEQVGALLAATVNGLDAYHLFSLTEAGGEQWLAVWDGKLLSFLRTDDTKGFTVVILCGEEDYDSDENSLEYFVKQKRKTKVRIAFMRLMNGIGLQEDTRQELLSYLQVHTKGCESEETWEVVLQEHGQDRAFYEAFAEYGCVTEKNFDALLADIDDSHMEMKAFFMKYKEETLGYQDFFEGLSFEL